MATVCLDSQVFYTPPAAAAPKPASRGLQVRNGNPSAAILGAPLRLPRPQDAHDAQHGITGESWHDAVLIPSDDEPDDNDLDGDQFDTSFPPLDELLPTACKELKSRSVVGAASNSVNAAPDDSDVPEPSVSNGPGADNESPEDLRVPASLRSLQCAGLACREGLGCPKHPNLSAYYRRRRNPESLEAEADNALYPTETLPSGSSDIGETELLNGRSLTREDQYSAETGDDTGCLPLASSGIREGTLCRDEGSEGDEPEPANSEPPSQPPDVGGDCNYNLEEDCRPAHPPVSDDRGEQREHGSVPPQAQEGRASLPRVSNDGGNNERRRPSNTAIATGGTASQPQARCRRRRDADDGKDYRPGAHGDAERSEDDDGVVQSPRRKRSKASDTTVSAASQRQTRPHRGDSSRKARTLSQRPRRQRGAAHPPSSRESTLERDTETDRAPAATFEEWPLGNAVLKRVTMNGSPPTFMLQFTWDPCAEHRAGYRGTENRDTVSSAKRHRPARQKRKGSMKDEDKPTSTSRGARYTPADDAKIRRLKEQGLSWIEIVKHFPSRSAGAIEVRYYTKLKTADPSQPRSQQLRDHSRTLSPVVGDDGGEEEWEVEEICGERRPDDGGLELLVKWKGGEETWEPYENVAETEALDEYERLHGRVSVEIV